MGHCKDLGFYPERSGEPLKGSGQRNYVIWFFILKAAGWYKPVGGGQDQQRDQLGCSCKGRDDTGVVEKLRSKAVGNKRLHSKPGVMKTLGESLSLKCLWPWSLKERKEAALWTLPMGLGSAMEHTCTSPIPHIFKVDTGVIDFFKKKQPAKHCSYASENSPFQSHPRRLCPFQLCCYCSKHISHAYTFESAFRNDI